MGFSLQIVMVQVIFNTPYGYQQFEIDASICIDPLTNSLYKFAEVHGKTWQITFIDDLQDQPFAFTPSVSDNHRGLYVFNSQLNIYVKY
jgi:hypothetical protein